MWGLHAQVKPCVYECDLCICFAVVFTCHPSDQACSSMLLPQWLVILPALNQQRCSRLWTDGQIISYKVMYGTAVELLWSGQGPLYTVPMHSLKRKRHDAFMWPKDAIISLKSHILFSSYRSFPATHRPSVQSVSGQSVRH